jgi:hypothetical protein
LGAASTNQLLLPQDRLRTLTNSRAMVQLVDLGRVRVDERTTLEILPPRNPKSKGTLDLKAGAMYFFTRDRPREFEIQTPQALAASRGTEFLVSLEPDGRELFVVYDGEVELTNYLGQRDRVARRTRHRRSRRSAPQNRRHREQTHRSMVAVLSGGAGRERTFPLASTTRGAHQFTRGLSAGRPAQRAQRISRSVASRRTMMNEFSTRPCCCRSVR